MNDSNFASLAARIEVLENLEAIRQLVYRYSELCDHGYDADGLAELFTEDGFWTSVSSDGAVSSGEYNSREKIRAYFAKSSETIGPMTLHYVMAPVLQVSSDGTTAAGRWYSLVPATMKTKSAPSGEAVLFGATYEHEYRKVAGAWKFTRIVATMQFSTPISKGWVEVPFVQAL